MGSIQLECPLCCCLTFSSSQTLRDHLSPFIWDSLTCAVCGEHFYGIQQLWFHLEEHISSVGKCPGGNDSPNIVQPLNSDRSDEFYVTDKQESVITSNCETESLSVDLISAEQCFVNDIILEEQQLVPERKNEENWATDSKDTNQFENLEGCGADKASHAFLCGICDQTMASVSAIHNHALTEHGISHIVMPMDSCSSNNEEEALHSVQNLHIIEDLSTQEFTTDECDQFEKPFLSQGEQLTHQKTVHQKQVGVVKKQNHLKHECNECKKYFRTAKVLAEHQGRLHLKIKTCLCPQCGMTFYDQHGLRAHMKTHDGNKRFTCQYCNKQFVWAADLRRHEGKHTGKMTHICEICGKGYLNGYQLNVHIRTHTGDRPFMCLICGATFMSKSNLRSHKIVHSTHTGDNEYACKYCSKTFPNRIKLYHHHRMHTKPFKCSSCGHGFTCTRDLEQHMRTHTKDYTCRICGTQFTQAAKLLKHESSHEKESSSLNF